MLLDRNSNKILLMLALGLSVLTVMQKIACTGNINPKRDNYLIDFSSDSEEPDNTTNDTVIPETTPTDSVTSRSAADRIHEKLEKYVVNGLCGAKYHYFGIGDFFRLPDDEIPEIKLSHIMFVGLFGVDFVILDEKIVAIVDIEEKGPKGEKKMVKKIFRIKNLEKKNSHVKEIYLPYRFYLCNTTSSTKASLKAYLKTDKKLEMGRIRMLISILHHYFDSLEVIYLSINQKATDDAIDIFHKNSIYLEGGMPSLKTMILGIPEKKIYGFTSNSYELDPVVFNPRSILQGEEEAMYQAEREDFKAISGSRYKLKALEPDGETLKHKLDNKTCSMCNCGFKERGRGMYSKYILITKCRRIYHYKCVVHKLSFKGSGPMYNREKLGFICCNTCDNDIRTRKIYHQLYRSKKKNESAKYSFILMKFDASDSRGRLQLDSFLISPTGDKEVYYDQRPIYTIPISLNPLESPIPPSQPPVENLLDLE